eukprot:969310-Amphidinium_carterae.1
MMWKEKTPLSREGSGAELRWPGVFGGKCSVMTFWLHRVSQPVLLEAAAVMAVWWLLSCPPSRFVRGEPMSPMPIMKGFLVLSFETERKS